MDALRISSYTIRKVEFPSEGATLRGLLHLPEAQPPNKPPIVIMAHGLSATVRMVADKYAEAFCRAGLAVLLYDHRNLGSSGGEPRPEVNPWIQARGYLDAMNFSEKLDKVDHNRMALWGDSYSAVEVMVVSAIDKRVRAIVAQVPVCGAELPRIEPSRANFKIIEETFLTGDVRGSPKTTKGPIPVVSSDQIGTPSVIKPIQAFRWFIDYGGRPGSLWINSVTRVTPATPVPFNAVLCAPFVRAPILMMVAPEDEIANASYSVAKEAFQLVPGPKQWYDIGGGHFGLIYFPGEVFDEASRVQTEFFKRWLSVL